MIHGPVTLSPLFLVIGRALPSTCGRAVTMRVIWNDVAVPTPVLLCMHTGRCT